MLYYVSFVWGFKTLVTKLVQIVIHNHLIYMSILVHLISTFFLLNWENEPIIYNLIDNFIIGV